MDGRTYRATERAIRYEAAEAVEAKGKSEPVEAWVAVAPRSIVPEQVPVGGLPLIGRDAEADLLHDALDRSRREPSTQLVRAWDRQDPTGRGALGIRRGVAGADHVAAWPLARMYGVRAHRDGIAPNVAANSGARHHTRACQRPT